jgi:hypothetical protein
LKLPPRPKPAGKSVRQALKAAWYWVKRLERLGELPLVPLVVELVEPLAGRRPPKPAEATLAGTPWLSRHCVNLARDAPAAALDGAVVDVGAEAEALLLPPPQAVARTATPIRGRAMKRARLGRDATGCISVTFGVQLTDMKRLAEEGKSFIRSGAVWGVPSRRGWRLIRISANLVRMSEC